jgi:lipopolysaccharide/colanic/teichoic acid biosynthesis glycosyltransferase
MTKILITGKDSYIGTSFKKWVGQWPDKYQIMTIDVKDDSWKDHDFSIYDVVLNVAAIVHVKGKSKDLYYKVNRNLAFDIAKITRLGKFLRKSSLDELPQIINILKGDMSIIGPRPALWNQYDLIKERDKYNVHKLYPVITGYAQIKGRDTLPIPDKAKLDGYYVKHNSLWLDIKIFILTFISVFRSDGIIEGGTGSLENSK